MHCRVSLNIRFLYSFESLFSYHKPDPRFLPLGPEGVLKVILRAIWPVWAESAEDPASGLFPLPSFLKIEVTMPPKSPKNWLSFHFIPLLCSDYENNAHSP